MADKETVDLVEEKAALMRRHVIEMGFGAGGRGAHFGPALSSIEIVASLFFGVMNHDSKNPNMTDRDRFVQSKGHACLALYSALGESGYITREQMATFMRRLSTSRAVDSGSVDGLEAAEISRASYNHSANVNDIKNGAVLSTTIVAPRPGILIAGGNVRHLNASASIEILGCDLKGFNPQQAGATDIGVTNDAAIPDGTSSCVVTGANIVSAGTWTVTLNVRNVAADTTNGEAHVWAQFVPFDGNGVPVLG